MSFWQIFRPKFTFQKILPTVNKITASIKTLLTATLPAVTQAAAITHDDVKLQIDNFDILIYAIQIMIVMAILIATIWLCTQFWNCINTRNLGKLQEKLTFMKFLYVVHLRDHLFSYQLCGAYAPRFPPGGEGMCLIEL